MVKLIYLNETFNKRYQKWLRFIQPNLNQTLEPLSEIPKWPSYIVECKGNDQIEEYLFNLLEEDVRPVRVAHHYLWGTPEEAILLPSFPGWIEQEVV